MTLEVIEKIGLQVPSLVVLVLVVRMFLESQKDARLAASGERKEMFERLNLFHAEHLTARAESRRVIEDAANALRDVVIAVKTR